MKIMKSLPDQSVDCFMCDLPYGQLNGQMNTSRWDSKIDIVEFWKQVKRLCRDDHTPVLMFCNTKFGNELINSNPTWFRYDLVWNKGRGVSFLTANKMPLKSHEMLYVFSKKGAYYNRVDEIVQSAKPYKGHKQAYEIKSGTAMSFVHSKTTQNVGQPDGKRCSVSVQQFSSIKKRNGHPTEKPADLYRWLLERYCPAGGTVLDPTAGSCNSLFTAREMGLHGIGIEMDRGFFYKALCVLLRSTKSPTS